MQTKQKTCFIICGPTSVGKTGLAIELATVLNTSIISADSRQCYRELTIGVAKPTNEELQKVPHFFINSHSIVDDLNAADFDQYATRAVNEIFTCHSTAVMAGGTGLYINAFANGMDEIPGADALIRVEVRHEYAKGGVDWLRSVLQLEDPLFLETESGNPQRMMRALEVMRSTGRSIRSFQQSARKVSAYNIIRIGLELPRERLYERINARVDAMLAGGLLEEAHQLYEYRHLNALNTVGYKELFAFIEGFHSLEEAIRLIKQNTRHYAKRQMTWFKKDDTIKWFNAGSSLEIINYCMDKFEITN